MLDHVFSPITINGKEIKNRTAVPAMVMNLCNEDGTCTERFTAYHEEKAKGGFGLIVTEDFAICPEGKGFKYIPGLWNDDQIEGFSKFTERIHKYDTTIIAQVYHAGRQSHRFIHGKAPETASAIPCPFSPAEEDMPQEITIERIHEIVEQFGDCAKRAEIAGFDGVEIHGAHGYLLAQFLSPYSNKRTDEYGGPLQNRIRLAQEVIENIRSKVSKNFIVGYRISANEYVTGGLNLEDVLTIIPMLEPLGIDYFSISAGVYRSFDRLAPSQFMPHAWNAHAAEEVKRVVKSAKVFNVGRYNDIRIAETELALGRCDMVLFGRQSLTEPHTPNLAKEGRFDEIRQCLGCHHKCLGSILTQAPAGCILNPETGNEYKTKKIEKTKDPKKVMVIGAGPGGLAAAIEAGKKGHNVKVYEKRRWAGGQFRLGSVPAAKGEIDSFIVWQTKQCQLNGIDIIYNTEVDLNLVKKENPDIIVAATGANPIIPESIKGIDGKNVVTANDVLEGKKWTGHKIAVIGGGTVGTETANHLASYLKDVTLVEMLNDIATDEALAPRWNLLEDLEKNKVKVYTNTKLEEVNDQGVVLSGKYEGQLDCDTVVLSMGSKPNDSLASELENAGYKVEIIGDAKNVGLATKAIMEGYELGRQI